MPDTDAARVVAHGGIERILTNNTHRRKRGGNAPKSIVRRGQEQVLFNQVIAPYPDVVGQLGGDKNPFAFVMQSFT